MARYSFILVALLELLAIANASPIAEPAQAALNDDFSSLALGVHFNADDKDDLPLLKLPYGIYKAREYNKGADMYKWTNIRFGAPPVGHLRWEKPAPPATETKVNDGKHGPQCLQTDLLSLIAGAMPDFDTSKWVPELHSITNAYLGMNSDEDCLFLDIYVPAKAIKNPTKKYPVINWIFGGGYLIGSKELTEDTGIVRSADGDAIVVAANYRLGALGWLAGSTVEKEGVPNVALWDQRTVLEWIQKNIGLVGGDKDEVTAWGESAGGGSIMHLLVGEGGKLDPLFTKALVMSPAFFPWWDRNGQIEDSYKKFARLSGCEGQGLSCLRGLKGDVLAKASIKQAEHIVRGSITPFGPVPDGKLIRQLPALELASGNYYKGIKSLIVTHVKDEGALFVDRHIKNESGVETFWKSVFPNFKGRKEFLAKLNEMYPDPSVSKQFDSETSRLKVFTAEAGFTCNTRYLAEAYPDKTWMGQHAISPGWHALDLLDVFDNDGRSKLEHFPIPLTVYSTGAKLYQSYLTSQARSGDPNTYRTKAGKDGKDSDGTIEWPKVDLNGNLATNVLNIGNAKYSLITDPTNPKEQCHEIRNMLKNVTAIFGLTPKEGSL